MRIGTSKMARQDAVSSSLAFNQQRQLAGNWLASGSASRSINDLSYFFCEAEWCERFLDESVGVLSHSMQQHSVVSVTAHEQNSQLGAMLMHGIE
jgi:hypothetical protein